MTGLSHLLLFLLLICGIFSVVGGQGVPLNELFNNQNEDVPTFSAAQRGLKFLVQDNPIILEYHNGPLLSSPITPAYLIWYGAFSEELKSTVRDFFLSFNHTEESVPTVSSWWNITSGYKDGSGRQVTPLISLRGELDDSALSLGKVLNESDLELLVLKSCNSTFPADSQALYFVLTADDVQVSDFCENSCASHFATSPVATTEGKQLPYAWVGNAAKLCAGRCAWPFAKSDYGPATPVLIPPNADVGTDGMIINLASMIAGTCTNPFNNGFYQGDGGAPLEAATACVGIYGEGSYSGYPGLLQSDEISGASFNVHGANGRRFLVNAIWNPVTRACTPPP